MCSGMTRGRQVSIERSTLYWNEPRHFIFDARDDFLFTFAVVNELEPYRIIFEGSFRYALDSVIIYCDDDVGCGRQAFLRHYDYCIEYFVDFRHLHLLTAPNHIVLYIMRRGFRHSYNRILCDNTAFSLQSRPL